MSQFVTHSLVHMDNSAFLSTRQADFEMNLVSQDGSEGFLRPSIPVNGGIRFHPDHSMDETFLNDSTDHMKSR